MTKEVHNRRIASVRTHMEKLGIHAIFLSPSASFEYLTG